MNNSHPFSQYNKRFYPYFAYLKQRFGGRTAKIPLDGGFTCPNRDGTKGFGGCIFCSDCGSGDFIACAQKPIDIQYNEYRNSIRSKWDFSHCIAYFQSFTGTYAPPGRLRELYSQALSLPDVVGLSIATRPDCIGDEVYDVLAEFAEKTDLTIELGVQTFFDETAQKCNMCHTWADTLNAVNRLHRINAQICVHLINGLPDETHDMMVYSAKMAGRLGINGIKLHLLHVLKNTALASYSDYKCLSRDEYVSIVCDQLEFLPSDVVIQRLTGDGRHQDLIAPDWSRRKREVLNCIDMELKRRDSWQGRLFSQ